MGDSFKTALPTKIQISVIGLKINNNANLNAKSKIAFFTYLDISTNYVRIFPLLLVKVKNFQFMHEILKHFKRVDNSSNRMFKKKIPKTQRDYIKTCLI